MSDAGGSSGSAEASSGGAFSLELGDALVQTRDWLHEFATTVIRLAAAEWDEREETPWPVLEEAAKIGLYSLDFYVQQYLEGSGLGIRSRSRSCSGATRGSGSRWPAARWPRSLWWPTGRLSRSGSGARRCSAVRER